MYSKFKQKLTLLLIFITVVIASILIMIDANQMTTSGLYKIVNKSVDNNHFYIEILEKQVECTVNEYNLIIVGSDYDITFFWNKYWPNRGRLKRIAPFEILKE